MLQLFAYGSWRGYFKYVFENDDIYHDTWSSFRCLLVTGVDFWFDTSSQDQIKARKNNVAKADFEIVSVIIVFTKNTEDDDLVLIRV